MNNISPYSDQPLRSECFQTEAFENVFSKIPNVKKTQSVFQKILNLILMINDKIDWLFNDVGHSFFSFKRSRVYKDCVVFPTHNTPKFEDIGRLATARLNPYRVNEEIVKCVGQQVAELGFDYDTNQTILLSPNTKDGKCFGGVSLFLKSYLSTNDIVKTTEQFAGGVPFEAVLNQEIYGSADLMLEYKIHTMTDFAFQECVMRVQSSSPEGFQKIVEKFRPNLSEQKVAILDRVFAYFNDPTTARDSSTFIQTIKNQLDFSLLPEEEASLKILETNLLYGVRINAKMALTSQGLDIETDASITKQLFELATGEQEQQLNLQPGAYQLGLPCSSKGKFSAFHAVALIVEENGLAYLYDPNFAIIEMKTEKIPEILTWTYKYYGSNIFKKIDLFSGIKLKLSESQFE